jgi:hypothetical protein
MDAMTSPAQATEALPAFADPGRMEAGFEEAAAAGEPCERWLTIGDKAVRVRAAHPEMLGRLTRTFTHLGRPEGGTADLTVHFWDSATLGTSAPPLPQVGEENQPGAFFYFSDDRVRAGFQLGTSGDPRVLEAYPFAAPPSLSVLDTERAEAWYWVGDASQIPYWEEATAIRFLLDWWLRERGIYQLHAGAVGTAEGGVLLCGKSGSGKSTATLACLESDLLYAGDDYVAVGVEPEPRVHSLYSSGKVMPDHVQRLPFLLPAVSNSDQVGIEKAVVYVHEAWPTAITAGFPLRALLAPRVTPGLVESRVVEISRIEGLAALAPSTVFQMHTRAKQSLAAMSRLLERVPCYRLELGSDISSIPRAIEGLLR